MGLNLMLSELSLNTVQWVFCAAFLYTYYRPFTDTGFKMMYILNIIDVVFAFLSFGRILFYFEEDDSASAIIFTSINYAGFYLTIFWSTAIAIFIYTTSKKKTLQPRTFMLCSLIFCFALSLFYPLM